MFESAKPNKSVACSADVIPRLVIIDATGIPIEVREPTLPLLGFTPAELSRFKLTDLLHEHFPDEPLIKCKQALRAGHSWRGVIKCRTKDGLHQWLDAVVTPYMRGGLFHGAVLALFPCNDEIIQRAASAYQTGTIFRRSGCMKAFLIARLLVTSIAIGCFAIFSTNLLMAAGVGLLLITTALWLGWHSLANLNALTKQDNADPLTCYIYTGGTDEVCRAQFVLGTQYVKARAISAWIVHHAETFHHISCRQQRLIACANHNINHQETSCRTIAQVLRNFLDDQHRATCAATRIMQLTLETQQDVTQSIMSSSRLPLINHQQQHRLQRAHDQLNTLIHSSLDLDAIIDSISEAAEEISFIAHTHQSAMNRQSEVTVNNGHIHKLANSTKLSIQEFQAAIKERDKTLRDIVFDIEASIQISQQQALLTRDSEHTLQSISSVMSRVNFLALDIDNALHHQSILRASATEEIESVQAQTKSTLAIIGEIQETTLQLEQRLEWLRSLSGVFTHQSSRVMQPAKTIEPSDA